MGIELEDEIQDRITRLEGWGSDDDAREKSARLTRMPVTRGGPSRVQQHLRINKLDILILAGGRPSQTNFSDRGGKTLDQLQDLFILLMEICPQREHSNRPVCLDNVQNDP